MPAMKYVSQYIHTVVISEGSIDDWKRSVMKRPGFEDKERNI